MITTAIIYDHRNREGKDGLHPIEIRVTINGKAHYVTTGVRVRPSEWKNGQVCGRADCIDMNKRLEAVAQAVNDEVNSRISARIPISMNDIKDCIWQSATPANDDSLIDWVEEQIDVLTLKEGTLKHYRTLVRRMKEYGNMRRWEDLTIENIYMWDGWLHHLEKVPTDAEKKISAHIETISDGAIYNYHKCLKAVLNRAVRFGKIEVNPYDRLRGQFKRGDRETVDYLTVEELKRIEDIHPLEGSQMAVVRDLFVFQAYTGMAYSDTQEFDIRDYQRIDGELVKVDTRKKTGVVYVNQLLPPAVEILERYGWKVLKIGNAKYNLALKSLAEVANIRKRVTSHMARHTFATTALQYGVPIDKISAMLGHTNITQTQRYAKTLPTDVMAEFSKLKKK